MVGGVKGQGTLGEILTDALLDQCARALLHDPRSVSLVETGIIEVE